MAQYAPSSYSMVTDDYNYDRYGPPNQYIEPSSQNYFYSGSGNSSMQPPPSSYQPLYDGSSYNYPYWQHCDDWQGHDNYYRQYGWQQQNYPPEYYAYTNGGGSYTAQRENDHMYSGHYIDGYNSMPPSNHVSYATSYSSNSSANPSRTNYSHSKKNKNYSKAKGHQNSYVAYNHNTQNGMNYYFQNSFSNSNSKRHTVPQSSNSRHRSNYNPTAVKKEERVAAKPTIKNEDEKTQREKLQEQLISGNYECMICCERIKQNQSIWSCINCFNCFHLACIKKWASSSKENGGWRCPACQNENMQVPNVYYCFCSKMRDPEWNRKDTPHSCGEMCGKKRNSEWCQHKCNILCHPGPCPPCSAFTRRNCACGAISKDVRCTQTEEFYCENICDKLLHCGVHRCERKCHTGSCENCSHVIYQKCYCGKSSREVQCNTETASVIEYSCQNVCDKLLNCGNHKCKQICHPDDCLSCSKSVDFIKTCPCTKVNLEDMKSAQRRSCIDDIPTCGNICGKILKCGIPGFYHTCTALCHEDDCPPCVKSTPVNCRCGSMKKTIPCSELTTKADEVICQKQCKKIRHCGRHKCGIKCCIYIEHVCTQVCGRFLSCSLHKCQEQCHRGNCLRCLQTSFDELRCYCGTEVIYPPVPCGAKPPLCTRSCIRPRACGHPSAHECHPDDKCPPCTALVEKPCFKGHKAMKSTPCYVSAISCGSMCEKTLPCGAHKCQKVCHEGLCLTAKQKCPHKCIKTRSACGHKCNKPCHKGLCPNSPCKEMVKVYCLCGNRCVDRVCYEIEKEYQAVEASILASQSMTENSVDLTSLYSSKPDKYKRLECNEECHLLERNRRLALALQIESPDSREKLGNNSIFSDFIKEETKKDIHFAEEIHATLTELVLKAKESKHRSRSYSFQPMNRDKRHFVHDYCKHFGCQSQSYDEEPKKNVVVTAVRGVCYLPPMSVVTLVQREMGQKKIPVPVLVKSTSKSDPSLSHKLEKIGSLENTVVQPAAASAKVIDYFDYEG